MSNAAVNQTEDHHAGGTGHIVDPRILVSVFLSLLVLTVLTVAASMIDLGAFNIWLALGIASLKATLVALFFMHLFWERPIASIVFGTSLLLVSLFIGLCVIDSKEGAPDQIPGYAPAIDQENRHPVSIENGSQPE